MTDTDQPEIIERVPDRSPEGVIRSALQDTEHMLALKRSQRETLRHEVAELLARQILLRRAAAVFEKQASKGTA